MYDCQDLIGRHTFEHLLHTRRPCEFNSVHNGRVPQTEVHAFVAGRIVADGCRGLVVLNAIRGRYLHLCSQSISVIGHADELQNDPMITDSETDS